VLRTYPAHEEGGDRQWNLAVTAFSGSGSRVERVHLVQTVRTPGGESRSVPGTEQALDADLVLLAIGFEGPVRDRLLNELDVELTGDGAIRSDGNYQTREPGIYVAGDARRGLLVGQLQRTDRLGRLPAGELGLLHERRGPVHQGQPIEQSSQADGAVEQETSSF